MTERLNCGQANERHVGREVELYGWCRYRRDHGGKLFIDLADRYGFTQLVFEGSILKEADLVGKEYVLHVSGKVKKRDADTVDKTNPTGQVEVYATKLSVISASKVPPFEIIDEKKKYLPNDELRLRYRYLDMRRREMVANIEFRDRMTKEVRKFMWDDGYLELETPILVKDTYDTGSRTFLVPSRTNKGKFYSLPQSPQIYKQFCMMGGLDKYFQMARCFRDEDPREDRLPEQTQIDIEFSFRDEAYVQDLIERLMTHIFSTVLGRKLKTPFRHMTYEHAMRNYGSDKPDLRYDSRIFDITDDAGKSNYNILKRVIEGNGRVKAMAFDAGFGKHGSKIDKNYMLKTIELAKTLGLKGLTWLYVKDGKVTSDPESIAESLGAGVCGSVMKKLDAKEGNVIVICADASERVLLDVMGKIRKAMGDRIGKFSSDFEFLWVEKFPLFEKDEVTGKLLPSHNPFTSPSDETVMFLDNEPEKVIGRQYDLVTNGVETGGGSIRISDPEIQRKILRKIGMGDDSIDRTFGFMIEALGYGAPIDGGIAIGFDRIVALLSGKGVDYMKDFVLFPKNRRYESPIDGSPTGIDKKRLKTDYGIVTED